MSGGSVNGTFSLQVPGIFDSQGEKEKIAKEIGEVARGAEQTLLKAFAAEENTDAHKDLAASLGFNNTTGKLPALEALRQIASERYQRIQRAWAGFEKTLGATHQSTMRLINRIGVN